MVAFEFVVDGCISYFVDNYYNFLPCERNTPHLLSRYEKHVNKPSLCQKRKEKESKIWQLAAEKKTYCNVSLKMKIRAHLVFRARCWGQPKIFLSVKASIINHSTKIKSRRFASNYNTLLFYFFHGSQSQFSTLGKE